LALVVYLIVPWLAAAFRVPGLVAWYVGGALVVLLPMLVFAVLMARQETAPAGRRAAAKRLRLGPLTGADVAWAFGGTLAVVLLTVAIAASARAVDPSFSAGPPFLRDSAGWPVPWLVLAWLPLFFSNILGEELCWRGYLLARQEALTGRAAWLLNGLLWCLFHWSFGWQIMLLTLPLALVLPALVQRRRNTWIGILMHAVFNAGGFAVVLTGVGPA
jgi:membrane protease YdiL (CAAX protease family)